MTIVLVSALAAATTPAFGQEASPTTTEAAAPPTSTAPAPSSPTADSAESAASAAQQPATQCELHIWPAERFQAMTTGLLGGGLLDAAIHAEGDKSRKSQMASALDPDGQTAALGQTDPIGLLKLQPARIIQHDQPLDRKTINKILTRRAESASPCYSELIVADVFYQKAAMWGRTLRTLFMFRSFGAAKENPVIYKSWGGNSLKLFPAKPGEDVEAANTELVTTFKKNFEEFTQNYNRFKTTTH
jgi:hypothetical protein